MKAWLRTLRLLQALLLVGMLGGTQPLDAGDTIPTQRLPEKSVAKAVLLSLTLPGGGQFYLGQPLKGVLFGGIELALLGLSAWKYQRYQESQSTEDLQNAFGTFILFVGTWAFSAADAYVSANLYEYQRKIRMVLQENTVGMILEVPMP